MMKSFTVSVTASLAFTALASVPAAAQQGSGRQSMQQCVSTVLTKLARSGTPANQVGSAVVSECDRQLRATLAESIRSGEAGNCTVESCLDLARSRAAEEAAQSYQQTFGRR